MTYSRRVFCTAVACFFLIATSSVKGEPVSDSSLQEQVRDKAVLAVAQLQDRAGGRLDYSVKSLEVVDEMLAEAALYTDQMVPANVKAIIELVGSYVLEVAYRQHQGDFAWDGRHNQPVLVVGEPKFHVALMTFEKVRGRLSGDESDNIVFLYQGFASRIKAAVPGTRALYT